VIKNILGNAGSAFVFCESATLKSKIFFSDYGSRRTILWCNEVRASFLHSIQFYSVVDLDPDVLGPPGSGPIIIYTDPDLDPSIK
jgi:hypothetical protein